jgi:hypothetical protein
MIVLNTSTAWYLMYCRFCSVVNADPHLFGCPGSGSEYVLGKRDPDPGAWEMIKNLPINLVSFITKGLLPFIVMYIPVVN